MQSSFSRHAVITSCNHHAIISRQWPRGSTGHQRSSVVISGSRPDGSVSCRGSRMNLIAAWRSLMEIVPSPLTSRASKRTSPDEGAHQLQSACKPRNNQGSSVWSSSTSPSSPAPKSIPNSAIARWYALRLISVGGGVAPLLAVGCTVGCSREALRS